MAVCYSSRGLVGLTKYLLEKHGDMMSYVLLGKIQSDNIERHFGHLRKISGGNYWTLVQCSPVHGKRGSDQDKELDMVVSPADI